MRILDPAAAKAYLLMQRAAWCIHYLDTCGTFTYEKLVTANAVAKTGLSRTKLKSLWSMKDHILPKSVQLALGGQIHPGEEDRPDDANGPEYVRWHLRKKLLECSHMFDKVKFRAEKDKRPSDREYIDSYIHAWRGLSQGNPATSISVRVSFGATSELIALL